MTYLVGVQKEPFSSVEPLPLTLCPLFGVSPSLGEKPLHAVDVFGVGEDENPALSPPLPCIATVHICDTTAYSYLISNVPRTKKAMKALGGRRKDNEQLKINEQDHSMTGATLQEEEIPLEAL